MPIGSEDHIQWSVQSNEILFSPVRPGVSDEVHQRVIATTDGAPEVQRDFDNEYKYAGLAVVGATYERSSDAEIASKFFGRGQMLNTGKEPIMAGDAVEYYVMDRTEADVFHKRFGTERTLPGLRKCDPEGCDVKIQNYLANHPRLTAADAASLATGLVGIIRGHRSHIIGHALSTADSGAYFDVLLNGPK